MNFILLKMQLLTIIRGSRSQLQMSRKLGYSFNQYHRWETNKVRMNWKQFVTLCQTCDIDLSQVLFKYFKYDDELDDSKPFLKILLDNFRKKDMAKKLNCSPSLFSKIMSGNSNPSVEQIFQIMYIASNSFFEFIKDLLPSQSKYPEIILKELKRREQEQLFSVNNPYIPVMIRILETQEYENLPSHSSKYISKKLRMPLEKVQNYFDSLLELKLVEMKDGKFKPTNKSLNLSNDFAGYIEFKKFWLKEQIEMLDAIKRYGNYPSSCYGGTMIMTLNNQSFKKIKEASARYSSELMTILHSDINRGEHDKIVCMHHQFTDILAISQIKDIEEQSV